MTANRNESVSCGTFQRSSSPPNGAMRETCSAPEQVSANQALRKSAFALRIGVSPGRVSQLIARGLPVTPDGLIDVASGIAWCRRNVRPGGPQVTLDAARIDWASLDATTVDEAARAAVEGTHSALITSTPRPAERASELRGESP